MLSIWLKRVLAALIILGPIGAVLSRFSQLGGSGRRASRCCSKLCRVASRGHLLVATTELVFELHPSRKKVLAASRQVRAAHDLPLLMQ